MVGYGSTASSLPVRVAMDIDQQNQRSKYASPHHHHYQQQSGSAAASSKHYSSRSGRNREDPEEGAGSTHRSGRSGRQSSRGTGTNSRSSSRYSPQPPGTGSSSYYPSSSSSRQPQQGPTSAPPSSMTPTSQQHFTPPQGHFGSSHHHHRNHHGATPATPDTNMQPTFPPPAVTSESPPPSEQSQRRPAYLLHRDLVIGKGSYGQVCIASRGEAEGHSSTGRSGKRKKFACKCVMLRNDPKYISKLQEEVNVLRELRGHDNVIRLYDVFCVDNELFIITELGRGGDLFHLLTTHPKHGVTESYAGM